MGFTYSWNDLINVGRTYGKGIPLAAVTAQICDFTSNDIYLEYPWKQTIINTASGTIPLLDSKQDYTCFAPNIDKPLKAWLERTDCTPHQNRDLDVVKDLSVDVVAKSWYYIKAVSLQQAIGMFRLESAVQVPTGTRIELHVDYKLNPIKVVDTSQIIWFDDKYAQVALEGLLYWVYKLGDDSRAGMAQTDASGRVVGYTGQLGTFKAALNRMKNWEDFGHTDSVFPEDVMGYGRDANAMNIFGW